MTFGRSWYWQNFYFKGSIDEARLYNRALSADEVKALSVAQPA